MATDWSRVLTSMIRVERALADDRRVPRRRRHPSTFAMAPRPSCFSPRPTPIPRRYPSIPRPPARARPGSVGVVLPPVGSQARAWFVALIQQSIASGDLVSVYGWADDVDDFAEVRPAVEGAGGRFVSLPRIRQNKSGPGPALSLYHALRETQHDVVHLSSAGGRGFCVTQAKRLGLSFDRTSFVAWLDEPSVLAQLQSGQPVRTMDILRLDWLERKALAGADVVLAPTADTLRWAEASHWTLPIRTYRVRSTAGAIAARDVARSVGIGRPVGGRTRRHPAVSPGHLTPLVTVCIATRDRPRFLKQAIASIASQTYSRVELVVVDDGSTTPEAVDLLNRLQPDFRARGWRLVRQEQRYPGAARNAAATHARGEYLMFMDDDNVAMPTEVEVLVRAAERSQADVLVCGYRPFTGEDEPHESNWLPACWFPIGPAVPLCFFENCVGDTNMLIRRHAFFRAGGFAEHLKADVTEDWNLLMRCLVRGLTIEPVPEALYYYRKGTHNRARFGATYHGAWGAVEPAMEVLEEGMKLAFLVMIGMPWAAVAQAQRERVNHRNS